MDPVPKGFEDDLHCPAYSFLISHGSRHLLFDLGVRKDWWNLAPAVSRDRLGPGKQFQVDVEKNVADILREDKGKLGITPDDIEAVIWSHHHWDHTGDMTTLPSKTDLIVGPGFKKALLPFYPLNEKSTCLQSDIEGRNLREADMTGGLKIGRCDAVDFFGDGSFYLLSTPGHAPGHLCGLARLTTSPSTFLFMGGDITHHGGEFRPSQYLPLPAEIQPSPIPRFRPGACPGEVLQKLQRHGRADESFFEPSPRSCSDIDQTLESVGKLKEFDAADNVFVIFAHDGSVRGRLDMYPDKINDWQKGDVAARMRWMFLEDFEPLLP